ncbi:DUF4307 domain-containing protein [Bogoriella caseilytica]|uniref:Uncharacterized protein DUF4307 n=1 Tax=Bogoriella caseilytica TaxID=56055 RepID=A0A3N2BAM1_9MICO|nr:DUF4307 domain-containing protein [Bogoriella caseilytica]ROR72212.1 uncharacterized protein DUF4307 [Bogoriella caseilytica]
MTTPDPAIMSARYGRERRTPRAFAVAGVLAGLLVTLAVGPQLGDRNPTVHAEHLSYEVIDDATVTVRFALTTRPGVTARCSVVAFNEAHTQVGFREVTIGPVAERRSAHETQLTTNEHATTGSVENCIVVAAE